MNRNILLLSFCAAVALSVWGCNKKGNTASEPSSIAISFSPTSGPIGTLITIESGGGDLSEAESVKVGGEPALIVSKAQSEIKALVLSSTSGAVTVSLTSGVTGTSAEEFAITATQIISKQEGSKVVPSDIVPQSRVGSSVAISADGNTIIVGGPYDDSNMGAAWVFTRHNGEWSQQGSKLVGSGAVGSTVYQGTSVALSADGNIALVGGSGDDSNKGAVWVYTRTNGEWSQQGSKLLPSDAVGAARFGASLALTPDGHTAIIGGFGDDSDVGAAWIFTLKNGEWSQYGAKLVGTGAVGGSYQGSAVAISADGHTALVGGYGDDSGKGALWVFARANGEWAQQGSKLLASDVVGAARVGWSVAISADGNTALVGGFHDNSMSGAAWVFARTNGEWSQQGSKLVGSDAVGPAGFGFKTSLSLDGNIALISGHADDTGKGALWIFKRTNDEWLQEGSKLTATGGTGMPSLGTGVALSADGGTAAIGGYMDATAKGALWIFVP